MKDYGLQLYSVRDITKDDFRGTLKKVADMGYKMVESAGFFGHSASDVKSWLSEYGLTLCSTHTGWNLMTDDFDATVKYHKEVGCRDLIIPGAPHGNKEEIEVLHHRADARVGRHDIDRAQQWILAGSDIILIRTDEQLVRG